MRRGLLIPHQVHLKRLTLLVMREFQSSTHRYHASFMSHCDATWLMDSASAAWNREDTIEHLAHDYCRGNLRAPHRVLSSRGCIGAISRVLGKVQHIRARSRGLRRSSVETEHAAVASRRARRNDYVARRIVLQRCASRTSYHAGRASFTRRVFPSAPCRRTLLVDGARLSPFPRDPWCGRHAGRPAIMSTQNLAAQIRRCWRRSLVNAQTTTRDHHRHPAG